MKRAGPKLDTSTAPDIARLTRPDDLNRLFAAMDALSAEATRRGPTDQFLETELATHRAKRLARAGTV